MKVHIIGGGNLGVAIAKGIAKFSKSNQVTITRRNTDSILYLEELGITVSSDNKHQIQEADLIILTIKPYQVTTVLNEILPVISNKTIASAVSGVDITTLQNKTNQLHPIVKIMPNIAAQFGESATCISFQEKDAAASQKVIALFQDLGTAPIIDEKLMDAATVLGASGTAHDSGVASPGSVNPRIDLPPSQITNPAAHRASPTPASPEAGKPFLCALKSGPKSTTRVE